MTWLKFLISDEKDQHWNKKNRGITAGEKSSFFKLSDYVFHKNEAKKKNLSGQS